MISCKIIVASDTLPEEITTEFVKSINLVETKLLSIEMLSEFDTRFVFENDIWHVLRNNDKVWWALESNGVWTKGKDPIPLERTYIK